MRANHVAAFVLLASFSPVAAPALAQNTGEHVVLTRTADGFVRANPDGTQSTTVFSVPGGQELCLFDIVYSVTGDPNATTILAVSNTSDDGPTWRIFTDTIVLDGQGRGAGHTTYKIGPKLTGNTRVSPGGTGLTGIGMTLFGLLRPGGTAPCQ